MKKEIVTDNLIMVSAKSDKKSADYIVDQIFSDSVVKRISKVLNDKRVDYKNSVYNDIADTFAIFAIYKTDVYCGYIQLIEKKEHYELGIELLNEHRRQGIGTESVIAFCKYLKEEFGIETVELRIFANNSISVSFFKKLGAKYKREKPFLKNMEAYCSDEELKDLNVLQYELMYREMTEENND